jgi:hypothetical protein
MCVCMYVCMYVCVCVHITRVHCEYGCTRVLWQVCHVRPKYVCMFVCMYTYWDPHMICTRVRRQVCHMRQRYVCMHAHMYLCVNVCVYVCTLTGIHIRYAHVCASRYVM